MPFKEFDEDLQEPEQKSVVVDLSSKKAQKKQKELSKQNTQLAKSIDVLKKEREELLSDKHKLKSENKTLERELRKVNSKGELRLNRKTSQMSVDVELESVEEMALKIQSMEARLAERDRKLKRIRDRLQRVSLETPNIGLSLSPDSASQGDILPQEIPQNGGILDSSVVERILDERNKTSNLQVENIELRAKVVSLENSISQLQSTLAAKEGGEGKTRKKSGHFFRRGKAQSKSMVMIKHSDEVKERETVEQTRRSKSPDFLCVSESYQDMSDISLLATDPKSVGSLPSFIYAGLSPRTATKRAHGDLQTLQLCLKTSIDEKKQLGDQNKQLEAEVVMVKQKLKDQNERSEEKEQSLQTLECARELLSREKKELFQQLSTMKLANEQLKAKASSLEKQHTTSIAKKDAEISKLNDEVKQLKVKLTESEFIRKESEDVFVAPTTPKREIKTTKTVAAKPPPAPVSQSKSQENDEEVDKTKTRRTSQTKVRRRSSSSSLSADEHFDSVANTRALFEQKIVSFKDDDGSPKRSARKSSWTKERRGSYSNTSSDLKPTVNNHAKSSSFDAANIVLQEDDAAARKSTTPTTSAEKKTAASTTPTASKPKTVSANKLTNGPATVKSFTSTNKEITSVSKVSKIIVKSTASPTSSPVNGHQKSMERSLNPASVFQKQVSVPVITSTVHTTSSMSKTSMPPRSTSVSVDSRKDTTPTTTTLNGKRTFVQPVKSNSVILTTSSSTPVTSKVTVTTSSAKTSTAEVNKRNARNQQRPQSVLLTPPISSMQKASSLQNIPEQISSESTIKKSSPQPTETEPPRQKSPTPRRFQKRERSERPKTMYAGRAETTNLVSLISRFQQQESTKSTTVKNTESTIVVKTPVQNGVLSPTTPTSLAHTVTTPISPAHNATSTPPPSNVVMRNPSPRVSRPKTYYGAPSMK